MYGMYYSVEDHIFQYMDCHIVKHNAINNSVHGTSGVRGGA